MRDYSDSLLVDGIKTRARTMSLETTALEIKMMSSSVRRCGAERVRAAYLILAEGCGNGPPDGGTLRNLGHLWAALHQEGSKRPGHTHTHTGCRMLEVQL